MFHRIELITGFPKAWLPLRLLLPASAALLLSRGGLADSMPPQRLAPAVALAFALAVAAPFLALIGLWLSRFTNTLTRGEDTGILFVTIATTIMHSLTTRAVDIVLVALLLIGSVTSAQFGSQLAVKAKPEVLRLVLASIVLLIAFPAVTLWLLRSSFRFRRRKVSRADIS